MITFKLVLRFSMRKNLTFRWFSSMKFSTTSYALTISSNSNRWVCLVVATPLLTTLIKGHLLIGISGAGKMTLSGFVACINGLSVFHIKVIFSSITYIYIECTFSFSSFLLLSLSLSRFIINTQLMISMMTCVQFSGELVAVMRRLCL